MWETIELRAKVDSIFLDFDTGIPCGPIVIDLFSNGCIDACPEDRGAIDIAAWMRTTFWFSVSATMELAFRSASITAILHLSDPKLARTSTR